MNTYSQHHLSSEHEPVAQQLREGNADDADLKKMIAGEDVDTTWPIQEWLDEQKMTEEHAPKRSRQIHVLVVVRDDEVSADTAPPSSAVHRHPNRLKRWDAINKMARKKKTKQDTTPDQETNKKRKNTDIDSSVAYSSLSWADIEGSLPIETFTLEPTTKDTDEVLNPLQTRLVKLRKFYGDVYTGREAKRLMFIASVFEAVCDLLDDVMILMEEEVKGKNVHVLGCFEFVLKRGNKRISIVEAKRDDIPQGIAQNVTGLEALSDVEQLETTYGIVTNYLEWVFIIDDDEKIQKHDCTLTASNSLPTNKSLKDI